MRLLKRMRKRRAVYWPVAGRNMHNEPVFGQAIEIRCRWDHEKMQGLDDAGKETTFTDIVYVDRPVDLDGKLWLGKLENLEGALDPPESAVRIRKYEEIGVLRATGTPKINSDKFLMVAYT